MGDWKDNEIFYKGEILETTQAICKAFGSLGWTVDMIVDYGSHARGEARKDSDYDVNIYVHRPGWLYLFEEYAQRLVKQENEIVRWHEQIRQYFSGYKELSEELEQRVQKIVEAETLLPFYVTNVFDTRLVLYNMVRETWDLFPFVHGRSIGNWPVYDEIISFLKRTRPFHHRFFEVHLGNCFRAAEQANSALVNKRSEPKERRFTWLTYIISFLRNYVSLLKFVQGDWFTFGKDEVLDVVKKEFPDMFELMRHLYYLKYDEDAYVIFRRNGYSSGYLGQLSLEGLHQLCIDFKTQLHDSIKDMVATGIVSNEEANWISKNMAAYCSLQAYRELVKDV